MKHKIFECSCSDHSHSVRVSWFPEDKDEFPVVYLHTILDNRHGFFRRIWYALRYIFSGDVSKYGISQEAVLEKEEVVKLRDTCNDFLETINGNNNSW